MSAPSGVLICCLPGCAPGFSRRSLLHLSFYARTTASYRSSSPSRLRGLTATRWRPVSPALAALRGDQDLVFCLGLPVTAGLFVPSPGGEPSRRCPVGPCLPPCLVPPRWHPSPCPGKSDIIMITPLRSSRQPGEFGRRVLQPGVSRAASREQHLGRRPPAANRRIQLVSAPRPACRQAPLSRFS